MEQQLNDRIARLTSRHQPFAQEQPGVIVRQTPREPDPALVLRWVAHRLNDPYFVLDVFQGSKSGQFGEAVVADARALALGGGEPPHAH